MVMVTLTVKTLAWKFLRKLNNIVPTYAPLSPIPKIPHLLPCVFYIHASFKNNFISCSLPRVYSPLPPLPLPPFHPDPQCLPVHHSTTTATSIHKMIFVIFAPQTRFLRKFLLHTKVRKSRQNGYSVKTWKPWHFPHITPSLG